MGNRDDNATTGAPELRTRVYLLWHAHDLGEEREEHKLLGVFSSRERAEARRRAALQEPGFRDVPDGFEIGTYTIDEPKWTSGFTTVVGIEPVRRDQIND